MPQNSSRVRYYGRSQTAEEMAQFHYLEREVAGFRLTASDHPPGFEIPKHSHTHPYFNLILSGRMIERCRNRTHECTPATFVFTPTGEPHSNSFQDGGARCFWVELPSQFTDSVFSGSLPALNRSAYMKGGTVSWLATRAYKEACRWDDVSPLIIEGIMLEILAHLSRTLRPTGRTRPKWIDETRDILHARFSEKLTLRDLANAVDVHPVYLATIFRQHYGSSVGDYIRQLRVEFACQQITTTETPLVEIALAAGFYDQSHFSKVFKLLVGITPVQYRENIRLKRVQPPSVRTRMKDDFMSS